MVKIIIIINIIIINIITFIEVLLSFLYYCFVLFTQFQIRIKMKMRI